MDVFFVQINNQPCHNGLYPVNIKPVIIAANQNQLKHALCAHQSLRNGCLWYNEMARTMNSIRKRREEMKITFDLFVVLIYIL
jgi:hypothetical protein